MSFISYAQNFEDVMLWRALKHIETGFYIDVGANDPETDSVTKAFYDLGWRGINIEPVPQWFQRLQETRVRDINLQLAVGSQPGEITLYEMPNTGLSTAKKTFAERHETERGYQSQELKVPLDTLANLCEHYHMAPIHFLKIDVEGMEKAVLEGADFTKIRPWIALVESTLPNSQQESHSEWEPILLDAGYHYVYGDGLNRFYVADEHSELLGAFQYPPNLFDDFVLKRHLDSETRANNADSKAQAAELRTAEYEAEIQDTKERVALAETRADEAKKETGEANALAAEAQSNAKAAELRAAEYEVEIRDTKERVVQAEARADEAEKDVEETNILIRAAQSQADKARALSTEADIKAKQDQKLIEQLQSDLDYAKTEAEQIQEQLKEKDRTLEANQAEVPQLQAHSQWLQNEWDAAKAKNKELNHSSHHWWTVADGLNRDLQAVYQSKFWRITWPLRKLMQWLKWFLLFWVNLFTGLLRIPRTAARWFLSKSIRFVLRHERLKHRARQYLHRHPKLEPHLRAFSRRRGLIPGSMPPPQYSAESKVQTGGEQSNAQGEVDDLTTNANANSALTPRARQIYKELKTAIEKRHGSIG